MNKYHRLDLLEREEISRGSTQNKGYYKIADYLGRSVSAISREIKNIFYPSMGKRDKRK